MEHEFENDWNDLSILDSKLIDKEFDNTMKRTSVLYNDLRR